MRLQSIHQLADILDERLRRAELAQLLVVGLVCDKAVVVLDVDDHGVQVGLVDEVEQRSHARSAGAVRGHVNALHLGSVGLRIEEAVAVRG